MNNDIAIVGLSVDLPHARTLSELHEFLRAGRCAIVEPSPQRLSDLGCTDPVGPTALIDGYDKFDPDFFGISPGEALLLDPHQRRTLQLAVEAFQSAGLGLSSVRGSRCCVYLSGYKGDWRRFTRDSSLAGHLGASHAALSGRIAWALDLQGPATILDSGCCSSLLAIRQACAELRDGVVDLAIAGGMTLYLSLRSRIDGDAEVASEDGLCRSYDADARGTANGEGGAVVVLKRLDQALADGHDVLAVVRGFGVTHSGRRSLGMAAPSLAAQTEAIRLAWGDVDMGSIDVIEGHGSGTRLGDMIEARALEQVFGGVSHPVYLGSLKSNFGHADHAAGILGLVKAVASIRYGVVYPTVNCANPNEVVAASQVLRVLDTAAQWPDSPIRRAGVTSLGLTGTNVHVAIEQAEPAPDRSRPDRVVIALSGRSEQAVREHARRLVDSVVSGEPEQADPAALSDTLMVGFDVEPWRTAAVAQGRTGVLRYLRRVADATVAPVRMPDQYTRPPAGAVGHLSTATHDFARAQKAADAFASGDDVDWPAVRQALGYPAGIRRCLVPPRPFEERRYWPDVRVLRGAAQYPAAAPAAPVEAAGPAEIGRAFDAAWREVLGVETVGEDDDFFVLGGNSVLALKLTALLASRVRRYLDLPTIYAGPVVRDLRRWLLTAEEYRPDTTPLTILDYPEADGVLSYGQEALWYIDRLHRGGTEYSVPTDTGLCGRLDIPAMRAAVADFTLRHEVLRSHYVEADGTPRLAIDPQPIDLDVVDLVQDGPADPVERHDLARKIIRERVAWPFDLATGPLFRATVIRWDTDEYVLALNSHHSVDDGWTPRILRRDLAELYRAHRTTTPANLPPLAMRYADHAAWQRRQLSGPRRGVLVAYWVERLRGAEPLDLPTDRPRPPVQSNRGDRVRFTVRTGLTRGLRRVASRCAASLFAVTLAGYRTLLAELSGQDDISIGIFTVGRNRPEAQDVFGYFNNAVVLRGAVARTGSLRDAVLGERDIVAGALAHDDLPFSLLVQELKIRRDPSRHQLFQAGMTFQNLPPSAEGDEEIYSGLRRSRRWSPVHHGVVEGTAKWDLDLLLHETDGRDELDGEIGFSADLFDRSTVQCWSDRFLRILEAIVASDDLDATTVADLTGGPQPETDKPRSVTPVRAQTPVPVHERSSVIDRIVALWQDMLADEITPESDFFVSGGHSLLAIRMLVELRNAFGVAVDLQEFMRRPTPRDLATLIDPGSGPAEPSGWSRLVSLNESPGPGRPLYMMHPSGGTWSAYLALARELGIPLKATQCRLADLADVTAWPDFVRCYTDAIVEDSAGPYLLGGWSLGAYTAWSVAAQLRRSGHGVTEVFVLDAPANHNLGDQPLDDSHLMLQRLLQRQGVIPPPTRSFVQLHAFAVGVGVIDESMSAEELDRFFAVARHNDTLLSQAILPRLDVPVSVFAASATAARHRLGADLGWSRVAASVGSAEILDGGHFDLLNTHVSTVARAIEARVADR